MDGRVRLDAKGGKNKRYVSYRMDDADDDDKKKKITCRVMDD